MLTMRMKFVSLEGGKSTVSRFAMADVIHITRVHASPDGDTVFPEIEPDIWQETHRELIPTGEKDSAATTYFVYERAS